MLKTDAFQLLYQKTYYQKHKKKILKKAKKEYIENKEIMLAKAKKYYQENKVEISRKRKEKREATRGKQKWGLRKNTL